MGCLGIHGDSFFQISCALGDGEFAEREFDVDLDAEGAEADHVVDDFP